MNPSPRRTSIDNETFFVSKTFAEFDKNSDNTVDPVRARARTMMSGIGPSLACPALMRRVGSDVLALSLSE